MDVGSLVSTEHADRVMAHVDDAVDKGAEVLAGGRRLDELGEAFVAPTVLTEVDDAMTLAREETFGPVVSLYPVDDAEEAVARANDTEFGLNASVWTRNGNTSLELAKRIDAGSVGVNSTLMIFNAFDVPMGGVKASGVGRRHGRPGIQRFVEAHSIVSSIATGGGYETVLSRVDTPARARALSQVIKLWRHIPGIR